MGLVSISGKQKNRWYSSLSVVFRGLEGLYFLIDNSMLIILFVILPLGFQHQSASRSQNIQEKSFIIFRAKKGSGVFIPEPANLALRG